MTAVKLIKVPYSLSFLAQSPSASEGNVRLTVPQFSTVFTSSLFHLLLVLMYSYSSGEPEELSNYSHLSHLSKILIRRALRHSDLIFKDNYIYHYC